MFRKSNVFKVLCFLVVVCVSTSAIASEIRLPAPGTMVKLSESYSLPFIRGVNFDQSNPFNLEFIIDQGTDKKVSMHERAKLVRYFLAALTIPEDKMWVNLSPYESDRVIDDMVLETEIGETLLAQDYILKQLASSLTHPDTEIGQQYWMQSSQDDLSKIWIKPETISVYDTDKTVFITDVELKVESENDTQSVLTSAIETEVNQGKNFAELRQMVYSIILAQWFKKKFAKSLYSFYFDSEKMSGVNVGDTTAKEQVFERYVEAFDKGAYDMIKKERSTATGQLQKRHYFSGGVEIVSSATTVKNVAEAALFGSFGQQKMLKISSSMELKTEDKEAVLEKVPLSAYEVVNRVKELGVETKFFLAEYLVQYSFTHRSLKVRLEELDDPAKELLFDEQLSYLILERSQGHEHGRFFGVFRDMLINSKVISLVVRDLLEENGVRFDATREQEAFEVIGAISRTIVESDSFFSYSPAIFPLITMGIDIDESKDIFQKVVKGWQELIAKPMLMVGGATFGGPIFVDNEDTVSIGLLAANITGFVVSSVKIIVAEDSVKQIGSSSSAVDEKLVNEVRLFLSGLDVLKNLSSEDIEKLLVTVRPLLSDEVPSAIANRRSLREFKELTGLNDVQIKSIFLRIILKESKASLEASFTDTTSGKPVQSSTSAVDEKLVNEVRLFLSGLDVLKNLSSEDVEKLLVTVRPLLSSEVPNAITHRRILREFKELTGLNDVQIKSIFMLIILKESKASLEASFTDDPFDKSGRSLSSAVGDVLVNVSKVQSRAYDMLGESDLSKIMISSSLSLKDAIEQIKASLEDKTLSVPEQFAAATQKYDEILRIFNNRNHLDNMEVIEGASTTAILALNSIFYSFAVEDETDEFKIRVAVNQLGEMLSDLEETPKASVKTIVAVAIASIVVGL